MVNALPTVEQMARIKREVNHLLWTYGDAQILLGDLTNLNIQCASHTVITTALFARRGYSMTAFGGKLAITEPETGLLHRVEKHWWCAIDGKGIVNFSLKGESGNPGICCNTCFPPDWKLMVVGDAAGIDRFIKSARKGCCYHASAQRPLKPAVMTKDLMEPFPGAEKCNIHLPFVKIVEHLEAFLAGKVGSTLETPQEEAWRQFAKT